MGEAPVARLTQGCLTLLTIASPTAPAKGQGGRNAALQLHALNALRTLIVGAGRRRRVVLRTCRHCLGHAGWQGWLGRRGVPAVLELAEALPMKSKLGRALACSEAVKAVTEAFAGECLFRRIVTFFERPRTF